MLVPPSMIIDIDALEHNRTCTPTEEHYEKLQSTCKVSLWYFEYYTKYMQILKYFLESLIMMRGIEPGREERRGTRREEAEGEARGRAESSRASEAELSVAKREREPSEEVRE